MLLAAVFFCNCSRFQAENPKATFDAVVSRARSGDFSEARNQAARVYTAWQSKADDEWNWRFRLLYAELLLYNGETRKASELLAAAPPGKYAALLPRREMLRGYVAYREGRRAEAEAAVMHAARAAHDAADFELEADAELILATHYSPEDSGRVEEAIHHVLAIGKEKGYKYQTAAAWLNYGSLRISQSRFAEAIPYFENASAAAGESGATLLAAIAASNLATCYYNLGDFEQAFGMRGKAIEIEKRAGLRGPLSDSYAELGTSQWLQGKVAEAEQSLREALSLVDPGDSPGRFSTIACKLAAVLESRGSLDEAEALNQRALRVARGTDAELTAAVMLNSAAIAAHRGNDASAMEEYRKAVSLSGGIPSLLWSAYAALGSISARMGDAAEARKNFDAALRTIDASRAEQLQSQFKITFLSQSIRFYQEYVDLLVRQGDKVRALEVANSSRAAVLTQDLLAVKGASPAEQIRRARALSKQAGATILFYWLAPKRSYLWVLAGGELTTLSLGDGPQIAERVKSWRYLVEQEKVDPIAARQPLASRLYEELVGPALPWIPPGSAVAIVPDDALHSLNFESLVADAPTPHFWLEDVTISIVPSLGVLTEERAKKVGAKPSLLLVGDADAAGTGYAQLSNAGREMERVSAHFREGGITMRRDGDAVPSCYREAAPERFSTIHFAAHAEANERSPLDSAIILSKQKTGFRLYAHEIMAVPIRADLVTISACRGVGARTLSGEGLVGFEWAFFKAGARNVVAGLWDVNDRSTADLMDSFYGGVNGGCGYAGALRQAKLAMLRTAYRKPYYWAPFQLYTRGIEKLFAGCMSASAR